MSVLSRRCIFCCCLMVYRSLGDNLFPFRFEFGDGPLSGFRSVAELLHDEVVWSFFGEFFDWVCEDFSGFSRVFELAKDDCCGCSIVPSACFCCLVEDFPGLC